MRWRIYFIVASFFLMPVLAGAQSDVEDRRAALEQQLGALEAQIQEQQKVLDDRQKQSVTLERDVDILNAQIEKSTLSIKARNLSIAGLTNDIASKQATIGVLTDKIGREKESLGELVRKTARADDSSLPEVILSGQNLSQFFENVDEYRSVKNALHNSYTELATTKSDTEAARAALSDKRDEETSLRRVQELEQKKLQQQQTQKKQILATSRGIEAEYQKIIKAQQQSAAQIRAELFTLQGSVAIPFEKALEIATTAGKRTGVRPALILGIIAEESNLGENVGTGNWKVDMKAPRDTEPFLDITKRLGLNPDTMPVSKKAWYGWGGAMGPAQFIPSTWVLYEERIAKATGHNPPNPWDPPDAFMASAILLMDNGADKSTAAAERLAALRYLAGWTNAGKKAYAFYGDDVMDLAAKYQKQIDILNNS